MLIYSIYCVYTIRYFGSGFYRLSIVSSERTVECHSTEDITRTNSSPGAHLHGCGILSAYPVWLYLPADRDDIFLSETKTTDSRRR